MGHVELVKERRGREDAMAERGARSALSFGTLCKRVVGVERWGFIIVSSQKEVEYYNSLLESIEYAAL